MLRKAERVGRHEVAALHGLHLEFEIVHHVRAVLPRSQRVHDVENFPLLVGRLVDVEQEGAEQLQARVREQPSVPQVLRGPPVVQLGAILRAMRPGVPPLLLARQTQQPKVSRDDSLRHRQSGNIKSVYLMKC